MQPPIKYGAIFALIGLIIKLSVYLSGFSIEGYKYVTLAYLFLLLLAIALSVRYLYNETYSIQFKEYFKEGLKAGALFTVFISLFTWLYYAKIDTAFLQHKIDERVSYIANMPEKELRQIMEEKNLTRQDVIAQTKQSAETIFSPQFQSTATLIGMMILSAFYSAVLAAIAKSKLFPKG
ncbi:MAG: DUF4199 domain-containing protein [Bacteroidetes bacterium]|nr:MAG: DUF4199 domain-containing protein [Bacteroidota bacterium]